ncbi:WhiB family transcriptional regulator [Pseudonocardia acidicola]|uniref:Transcriptional regulator WhiB n=1 Tax=Pseudonocardia acidicola TaxID=2724939 RepID=A0ABX1S8T7_9PSEU|nr:WhiB family transcriptional regulator [Pseudonocardia acidicola]
MTGREWRSRAACRSVDPELFFPVVEVGPMCAAQIEAAKAVCGRCPVLGECLSFALAYLAYGVAGGLTAEERRGVAAGRGRTAARPAGRLADATRGERAAAGRAAIRAGRGVRETAREFGVMERTATRWAAQVRAQRQAGRGRGVA